MSAPMRRPRGLNTARPATADPYASRNAALRAGTPTSSIPSPVNSPARPMSKGSMSSSVGAGHVKSNSTTTILGARPGSTASSTAGSPRTSPIKPRPRTMHMGDTLQVGSTSPSALRGPGAPAAAKNSNRTPQQAVKSAVPHFDRGEPSHSSVLEAVDEDNFTLVLPAKSSQSARGLGADKPASAGKDEDVPVYEDPESAASADPKNGHAPKSVLEEVPFNERVAYHGSTVAEPPVSPVTSAADEERPQSVSPSKKNFGLTPDRGEAIRNRRLLVSGCDRVKSNAIDAHGFRRLQELVKNCNSELSGPIAALLRSLAVYLESAHEGGSKANSLRSQGLATARAIIVIHRREEAVRREYATTLCALVRAKEFADGTSHVSGDIDKTADEIIKHAHEQTDECISSVLSLTEGEDGAGDAAVRKRIVTTGLSVLSKLLGSDQARKKGLSEGERTRLGQVAVKLLDDTDADVRKADTELCLALHSTYGEGSKEEFWKALTGARETQLNLIAYYIARRSQVGTSS